MGVEPEPMTRTHPTRVLAADGDSLEVRHEVLLLEATGLVALVMV